MMWECNKCKEDFFEPDYRVQKEIHSELDYKNIETNYLATCPYCGSSDIDQGPACEFCGENIAYYGDFCKCCVEDAGNAIEKWGHEQKQDWATTKELFLAWANENW